MKKTIKKTWMVAIAAVLVLIIGIMIMAEFVKKKKIVVEIGSDTVRGMRNNNPLNLRRTGVKWKHEKTVVTDKEFEEFESLMWGLRAGLRNMRTKVQRGFKSLHSLISVWAPPTENDTLNYISIVSKDTGYLPEQSIQFTRGFMFPIVKSMCKIESNLELTKELYEEAWSNI